tara:strand:- start:957 stop:2405 length:1449 start_codon:yes stop_codon:yes gene_type:complete
MNPIKWSPTKLQKGAPAARRQSRVPVTTIRDNSGAVLNQAFADNLAHRRQVARDNLQYQRKLATNDLEYERKQQLLKDADEYNRKLSDYEYERGGGKQKAMLDSLVTRLTLANEIDRMKMGKEAMLSTAQFAEELDKEIENTRKRIADMQMAQVSGLISGIEDNDLLGADKPGEGNFDWDDREDLHGIIVSGKVGKDGKAGPPITFSGDMDDAEFKTEFDKLDSAQRAEFAAGVQQKTGQTAENPLIAKMQAELEQMRATRAELNTPSSAAAQQAIFRLDNILNSDELSSSLEQLLGIDFRSIPSTPSPTGTQAVTPTSDKNPSEGTKENPSFPGLQEFIANPVKPTESKPAQASYRGKELHDKIEKAVSEEAGKMGINPSVFNFDQTKIGNTNNFGTLVSNSGKTVKLGGILEKPPEGYAGFMNYMQSRGVGRTTPMYSQPIQISEFIQKINQPNAGSELGLTPEQVEEYKALINAVDQKF